VRTMWRDLRYGLRAMRTQPAFTGLAVLTLALGIGAATTIFSVIQNVLLDPFPYANADKIFVFQIRNPASPRRGDRWFFQVPEFLDYQTHVAAFEEVIAVDAGEDVLYATREGTEHFSGAFVSGNTFRFLGVGAAIGRVLTPDDAKPGAPPVFVMSHRMWAKLGQDPAILGRSFVLNGVPTTLVGIMPPRFAMVAADLWEPVTLGLTNPQSRGQFYRLQARLKPGVTVQQAEAEFHVVADRLARVYPRLYPKTFTVKGVSLIDSVVGPLRTTLYTLAAAVALLLLIACGNVANMLLARAGAREKEMAIRASLGASRGRLVRQLLIESLMLAVLGSGAGCLFAHVGLKVLVMVIPEGLIPPEAVIRVNLPVLLFGLAAAGVTALVFGLVPALHTARGDLAEPLRDSGKGVSGGLRRGRLSGALVVAEVALSMVLLAGAGLLMRSLVNLRAIDLGLNPQNVLFVRLRLPLGQYRTAAAKQQLFDQLLPRLQALPGVTAAAVASAVPLDGGITTGIDIPGKPHETTWSTLVQLCSEGYFRTAELRLLRGRLLSREDVNSARRVAVVNETLARRDFGQADPIGRSMKVNVLETLPDGRVDNPTFEIVGVVADAKNRGIQNPPLPESFIPSSVTAAYGRSIIVRTAGSPLPLLNSVRREIWAVNPNLVVTETGTVADILRKSYVEPRFGLVVLGVFAGVGLVLVALGVYGVIAYTVSRQTHEIGIRMALGAARGDVQRMVLRMGLRLIGLGVVTGLLASLAVTRVLASQLWGVKPHDPLTLGAVVVVVAAAGVSACYFPARRATRVDPIVALRYE
jgi:putative ABC transport system permease protein